MREIQHILSLERKSKLKDLKSLGNGKQKLGLKVGMDLRMRHVSRLLQMLLCFCFFPYETQMLLICALLCNDSITLIGVINILDLLKEQEIRNRSVFVCAESY